ncbi:MAG TPA: hypothetical protein VG411_15630, partial [Actinomycetota bacterium]|nr:hypothetical protein [Actinomycetota bacterium]
DRVVRVDLGLRRAGEVRWASDPEEGELLARRRPPASPPTTGRWSRRWCWPPAGPSWRWPGWLEEAADRMS